MKELAELHFKDLAKNPYPGRGIVCGLAENGHLIFVYWLMGRSENSRNRILSYEEESGRLFTDIAIHAKGITDTSLVIYNAMEEVSCRDGTLYVVSNGTQTSKVAKDYVAGKRFRDSMSDYSYEPDEPHFTPRITAICSWTGKDPWAIMSILRKSPENGGCDRRFYQLNSSSYGLIPGFGHCITTYQGNGNPLPSFQEKPYVVPLCGTVEEIADMYWNALDPENKVALGVKDIPPQGKSMNTVRNKHRTS